MKAPLRYRTRNLVLNRPRGWRQLAGLVLGIGTIATLRARKLNALEVCRYAQKIGDLELANAAVDAYWFSVSPAMHAAAGARLWELVAERGLLDELATDYGILSTRVITNAGAAAIVDAFTNTFELDTFNFHASGTGVTAEAATDTALVTEVESRVSGTQSQPASNQYETLAVINYTAATASPSTASSPRPRPAPYSTARSLRRSRST